MKTLACLLALLFAGQPVAFAAQADLATVDVDTLTVTARRVPHEKELKQARVAGVAVAAGGTGLMAYSVFFAAGGPIGWAAGLVFLGGMTAYLSHRRLNGEEDFKGGPKVKARAPTPGVR